jgi:hypothetical protein
MTVVSDDSMTTPELAIRALSNLLSANIDVGLKHSLGIGYHEDLDIRTAFVKVLCNILIQGTDFNNLSDGAVNKKYDELLDVSPFLFCLQALYLTRSSSSPMIWHSQLHFVMRVQLLKSMK